MYDPEFVETLHRSPEEITYAKDQVLIRYHVLSRKLTENHPVEKENHLPNLHFLGSMLVFRGVSTG